MCKLTASTKVSKTRIIKQRRRKKPKVVKKIIKKRRKKSFPQYTKSKRTTYTSKIAGTVNLDSTWELLYAQYLDKNNIKWRRNLIKFPYTYRKKLYYYIPDFYLIDEDVYVEVKGYQRSKDTAKWRDFPYTLVVLKKKELTDLGLNIK